MKEDFFQWSPVFLLVGLDGSAEQCLSLFRRKVELPGLAGIPRSELAHEDDAIAAVQEHLSCAARLLAILGELVG